MTNVETVYETSGRSQRQTESVEEAIGAHANLLSAQLRAMSEALFPPVSRKTLRRFTSGEVAKLLRISDSTLRKMTLAGEGPEREKLSFIRHQLNVAERVTLLGTQSQAEVLDQLRWADVLLLPSLSAGISNAVLEAMAAGLPVIATQCGGMAEVIDTGTEGFVVPIGDTVAMADRLAALGDDPDLRHRIGTAAAARAVAEFDIGRQIDVFARAYDALMT